MKGQGTFAKLAALAALGSVVASLTTVVTAESEAARAIRASAATVPTSIRGIYTFPAPPQDFSAVTAADVELATYGFPPRPDKQAHPDQYAQWERAMRASRIRSNGELKPAPGAGHATTRPASSPLPMAVQPATGPSQISTNNASGVIVTSNQKSFTKNSIANVYAFITVATAEFPRDTVACSGDGYTAISSVGIDGFVFNTGDGYGFDPQLQAGVYEQASCGGDIYYFAAIGWQGAFSVPFTVNPGDIVYAIAYTYGGSNSDVYLGDLTTSTYNVFSVTTSGIVGATANWTVERMCCSGNQPTALANTTMIGFGNAYASNQNDDKYFYPGSQASTTEVLTMTDDDGGEDIESVTQGTAGHEGTTGLWFTTENCGEVGGCTP